MVGIVAHMCIYRACWHTFVLSNDIYTKDASDHVLILQIDAMIPKIK